MLNETHIRVFLGTPNVFMWALSLGGFHKHTSVKFPKWKEYVSFENIPNFKSGFLRSARVTKEMQILINRLRTN